MARNNTLSASFQMANGDGASGFSESSGALSFTSGDAVKVEGSVGTSAVQYVLADFGIAQADGIYFENRDSSNLITLTLQTAISTDLVALKIAPKGVFCIRFDVSQTQITHITLLAANASSEFVLCVAE